MRLMQFVLGDTTGRVPAIERQDFKCSACPQVARRVVFSHALVSADELPIATHTEPRAIQLSDTAQRGTPKGREEIDEFVPKKEIEELYPKSPYYIVPDGEVGQQAFAVIREAIRQEGMVAIGKVV
jgi:Ku70/Ku80 beta-barrel domain